MKLIETRDLSVGYEKKAIIENINISLEAGKIVTLIGPNGSGKTTILKSIQRLLPSIKGEIYLEGKNLYDISDNDRAKIMSSMFTEKRVNEYFAVKDVIAVGRYPYTGILGRLSDEDRQIIDDNLKLTNTYELRDTDFSKLSDGQKQRVLLARALVQQPRVLILDEPTSFLDVGAKIEFMNLIKKLSKSGKLGILMSLHELDLAAEVSDVIVTVNSQNEIERIGEPNQILEREYISNLFNIKDGSYSVSGGFSLSQNDVKVENHEHKIPTTNENNKEFRGIHDKTIIETRGNRKKAKYIMVQGTMSSAGKSLIVAGLCRIFKQDGYRVAPFKSQNMALNSFITEDGLEMGRAQVMQAEAAGIKPNVNMNPILLKPTSDQGSQVIVNGKVLGNMRAREYFEYKTNLIPDILKAVRALEEDNDIIVIEGAGSPAEINLKQNDIVNMGMAKLVDAPVLLVGDIDRGGVFAQLLGTIMLLEEDEKKRVKGLIVNKFRGDKTILDPGTYMLYEKGNIPVVGVLPYMDINLEDEDSLTDKFNRKTKGIIDIAVIKLPHISNFTDFDVFSQFKEVSLRYVKRVGELEGADMIIIPGSKNTIDDLRWLRQNGFDAAISKMAEQSTVIFGICGGYQMLGSRVIDPLNIEGGGEVEGLNLLPITTEIMENKCRNQVSGRLSAMEGPLKEMSGKEFYGYEIHMGQSRGTDGNICSNGNVYGTYIHGIFDHKEISQALLAALSKQKGVELATEEIADFKEFKEKEYDRLADTMRGYMDMKAIYEMMGLAEG